MDLLEVEMTLGSTICVQIFNVFVSNIYMLVNDSATY